MKIAKRFLGLPLIFCILIGYPFVLALDTEPKISHSNIKAHILKLSKDIGERNFFNHSKLEETKRYIIEEFKRYGYSIELNEYNLEGKEFSNIIAEKKGKQNPDEIIVVGAHYDSVIGSTGADDNASGVSCLLELSRLLVKEPLKKTIRFIAFTNEEPPFFLTNSMGSSVYAQKCRDAKEDIQLMLCFESVGVYSDKPKSQAYPLGLSFFYPDRADFIAVVGDFRSRKFVKRIKKIFKKHSNLNVETLIGISLITGVNFSDHASFWKEGYRAVMITDTAFYRYPYYHTYEDTYEKLDYSRISEVIKSLYLVLNELDGKS